MWTSQPTECAVPFDDCLVAVAELIQISFVGLSILRRLLMRSDAVLVNLLELRLV